MLKTFYIADKQRGQTQDIDISLFAKFEQLTESLTKVFAFANPRGNRSIGT